MKKNNGLPFPFEKDQYSKELSNKVNEYNKLLKIDHNLIGRVLTCHLLLEKYVTDCLNFHFGKNTNIKKVRLSLYTKLKLLPTNIPLYSYILPGIREIDNIRHKFAHTLNPQINLKNMKNIYKTITDIDRTFWEKKNLIEVIEFFTNVSCSIMMGITTFEISLKK